MIRPIEIKDAEEVMEICVTSLDQMTTPEILREQILVLSADEHYYVAVYEDEADHKVKGFIQAEDFHLVYKEKGWNVMGLAVANEEKGKGYGRELLKALEEHAKKTGASYIRLNSRIERKEAHGFYEHLGYECDKTQLRFRKDL